MEEQIPDVQFPQRQKNITNILLMFGLTCPAFSRQEGVGFSTEKIAIHFLVHKSKPTFYLLCC